jgi:hypothetical protein
MARSYVFWGGVGACCFRGGGPRITHARVLEGGHMM